MTKSLETDLRITLRADYEDDTALFDTLGHVAHQLLDTLANGYGSDQADRFWGEQRTANATPDSLDLAGGLTDVYADSLALAKVKLLLVHNKETTPGKNLYVGGADANAFSSWIDGASDRLIIPPGGFILIGAPTNGFAVTAGTGDILEVNPGANSVTYDALLVGTSS